MSHLYNIDPLCPHRVSISWHKRTISTAQRAAFNPQSFPSSQLIPAKCGVSQEQGCNVTILRGEQQKHQEKCPFLQASNRTPHPSLHLHTKRFSWRGRRKGYSGTASAPREQPIYLISIAKSLMYYIYPDIRQMASYGSCMCVAGLGTSTGYGG